MSQSGTEGDESGFVPLSLRLFGVRRAMVEVFNASELADLCFDLGVPLDALSGQAASDKVRELISFMDRRGRLSELREMLMYLRPNVGWREAFSPSHTAPSVDFFPSSFGSVKQGYQLFWDGKLVGYEPDWTELQARENLDWNRQQNPRRVVTGVYYDHPMD